MTMILLCRTIAWVDPRPGLEQVEAAVRLLDEKGNTEPFIASLS